MTMRGLVVGKFFPPHSGHRKLIDLAASQADRVTVMVVDTPGQVPPAQVRAAWLRELHRDVEVRVIPDIHRDDDSNAWARHVVALMGERIDAVFTAEPYGEPWVAAIARLQDAACKNVRLERDPDGVSGTKVRENPAAWWDFLDAPVRAHYVRRVVVVGAESTGSTSLARSLADTLGTIWVPEYGRRCTVEKFRIGTGAEWTPSDFVRIAREQDRLEDRMAGDAPTGTLLCDTDSLATALWEEVYLGRTSSATWRIARAQLETAPRTLYLLTDHAGIPWEDDGYRLGDETRGRMTRRFEEVLSGLRLPWLKVTGGHPSRLAQAAAALESASVGSSDMPMHVVSTRTGV